MAPKVKLTPEEKKALKAQKKAEKKERLLEKKKQIKRDYLIRELKYGATTLKTHEQDWRKMLINISLPEMRKDLEFAWHNFERVVDCKDFTISLLMDEVNDAREQYMLNMNTHVENIERLIKMFRNNLNEIKADYDKEVAKRQEDHIKNIEEITSVTTDQENYLKTMIYMLQEAKKNFNKTIRSEYFPKLEEQQQKFLQVVDNLRAILENNLSVFWEKTLQLLNDSERHIKTRKKEQENLKIQDDALHKLITIQLEKIRKFYLTRKNLKDKLVAEEKLLGRRLIEVQSEHDFYHLAFITLKKKLAENREVDFEQLKTLTVNYNDALSYLQKIKERGEHILHVAAVCRKLETQEEKILPFPENFLGEHSCPNVGITEYRPELDLFCQRMGNAEASRYALNEEREFLLTENEILKIRLHKYCQCLKCPGYVPFKTTSRAKCQHVTEAAHELQKYKKQTSEHSVGTSSDGSAENDSFNLFLKK